jgi:hypothetical protein
MEETWIFLVLRREGMEWEHREEEQWTGICLLGSFSCLEEIFGYGFDTRNPVRSEAEGVKLSPLIRLETLLPGSFIINYLSSKYSAIPT